MSYTPPNGNSISLEFSDSYSPSDGDKIHLNFGVGVAPEGGVLNIHPLALSSKHYLLANAGFILPPLHVKEGVVDTFNIYPLTSKIEIGSGTLYWFEGILMHPQTSVIKQYTNTSDYEVMIDIYPSVNEIDLYVDDSSIRPGQEEDLPTKTGNSGIHALWGGLHKEDELQFYGWDVADQYDHFTRIPPQDFIQFDDDVAGNWNIFKEYDNSSRVAFSEFNYYDIVRSSDWKVFLYYDKHTNIPWGSFNLADRLLSSPYNQPPPNDRDRAVHYGEFDQQTLHFDFIWNEPLGNDKHQEVPWGPVSLYEFCAVQYFPPEPDKVNFKLSGLTGIVGGNYTVNVMVNGQVHVITFYNGDYLSVEVNGEKTYVYPGTEPGEYRVIWGIKDYQLIFEVNGINYHTTFYRNSEYFVEFNEDGSFQVFFDLKGINTDPRCPYDHNKSGRRDPYITGIPISIHFPEIPQSKDVYYMFNTVLIRSLTNSDPIEALYVNIRYDKQSWLWQFQIGIARDKNNYLDKIKPGIDFFTDIEISINGWKFVCRVESWNETSVFAKDAWNIVGRSPSMELGSPQNQKTSHIYDKDGIAQTAGGQIIDQVLQGSILLNIDNTGWVADWSTYPKEYTNFQHHIASGDNGWGFNPGAFSWVDKTQIEVVKELVDSIGGFIMTNPDCHNPEDKILYIKPHYDIPPWHWNSPNGPYFPNIDHIIMVEYSPEIARNFESLPTYTAMYVMGQEETIAQKGNPSSGIVIVEVHRESLSKIYAPDVVDKNITSWQSAVERGKKQLSETGNWLKHTFRLFSLEHYGSAESTVNKLLIPGDFVQIVDKNDQVWYGTIDSVDLTAASNNGAFTVYQTVEIRQYIGS